MFCPNCRTEYREGFTVCADCHIDLVDALPEKPEPEFIDFKEVLTTYNPGDVAFIKSLLESEEIQYFFKGEHFMYVRPLADPARLMVRIDQVEEAVALLKNVRLSFTGINLEWRKLLNIRKTTQADIETILSIHKKAFGGDKGPEIARLVEDLFSDRTAMPLLSLIAIDGNRAVGHILFTRARLNPADETVSVQLLAPLAVLPEAQSEGVGGQLIEEGLRRLKKAGVGLVFVLGHPDYYPKYGFKPAGVLGFEAPYPIPEEHAGAWMVQELGTGVIGRVAGTIQCSDVLDQPQHWRE